MSNVHENHEMVFRHRAGPGLVLGLVCGLPNHAGVRSLCGRVGGRRTGFPNGQVLLGDRIRGHRGALQSRRTCRTFSQAFSVVRFGLYRGVSGLSGCIAVGTDALDTVDNRSDSGKHIAMRAASGLVT